jgi:uncharacterized lipoprotein YmbA
MRVINVMRGIFFQIAAGLIMVAGLGGCAGSAVTHYYVLEAQQAPVALDPDSKKKGLIELGPVAIPALIDRKQIVTRTEGNSVRIAESEQWAEPLRPSLTEVLVSNLSVLLPRHAIHTYPSAITGAKRNYRIVIDIIRLDAYPGRYVRLDARWAVINEKTRLPVVDKASHIEHALTETSYSAIARHYSMALYELSQQLAMAIGSLK